MYRKYNLRAFDKHRNLVHSLTEVNHADIINFLQKECYNVFEINIVVHYHFDGEDRLK